MSQSMASAEQKEARRLATLRDFPSCADVGWKLKCYQNVSKDKPIPGARRFTLGTFAKRSTFAVKRREKT
jgi:hypothetical protein